MGFGFNQQEHTIKFTQDRNCVRIPSLEHNGIRSSLRIVL